MTTLHKLSNKLTYLKVFLGGYREDLSCTVRAHVHPLIFTCPFLMKAAFLKGFFHIGLC